MHLGYGRKLLVLHDDAGSLDIISASLRNNFEIVSIAVTQSTLERIEVEKPDMLLFNVNSPDLAVHSLLQKVREKYNTIQLPILMIIAEAETSIELEILCLGANDCLIEPIDLEVMTVKILTHIKIRDDSFRLFKDKEAELAASLVQKYNHEINNILAIGLGRLRLLKKLYQSDERINEFETTFLKIAQVLKNFSDRST